MKSFSKKASPAMALRLSPWRSSLVLAVLLAWYAGLAARALYLQGFNNDFLREKGDARYSRIIELPANRGVITDRNGKPLALSTPVESIWASPGEADITPKQLAQLAGLLELSSAEIKERLSETSRDFIYLKRQLDPETADKVMALDIPGISSQREFRRYYPAGEILAHVVGFTGVDDNGQEGMELAYQESLHGIAGSHRVIKDRRGQIVEDVESIREPKPGRDLALSVDSNIQSLAFAQLKEAVQAHDAKAGSIVVLDANTGEVLAMANIPTYNPNNRTTLNSAATRNRAVTDSFEPGSTLKAFTAAAVLEAGTFTASTTIETAPGQLKIGPATVHDAHANGLLTVAQVIQKSSNVGAAKMALSLSPERLWDMFNRAGFGSSPEAGFPGEITGKLRPYESLRPIEQATMGYGHGISISLLQLARAYTMFAEGGELKPVTFVKLDAPVAGDQVISPATAHAVRDMLELVVKPGGTAPRAQVMGYSVAGKTGTAHKLEGRSYAPDRYVSSFVGFAPASNPRLVIAVMIDEPRDGRYYGGVVAAPVFSQVMAGALRALNVPYDLPLDQIAPPPTEAEEVKEEV